MSKKKDITDKAETKYLAPEDLKKLQDGNHSLKDLSQQRELEQLKLALEDKDIQMLVVTANEQVRKLRESMTARQKTLEELKTKERDAMESRKRDMEEISHKLGFEGKPFAYEADTLKVIDPS